MAGKDLRVLSSLNRKLEPIEGTSRSSIDKGKKDSQTEENSEME